MLTCLSGARMCRPGHSRQRAHPPMQHSLHRMTTHVSSTPCRRRHLRKTGTPPFMNGAAAESYGTTQLQRAQRAREWTGRLGNGAAAQGARRTVAAAMPVHPACTCTMAHGTSRTIYACICVCMFIYIYIYRRVRGGHVPTMHSGRASGRPEPTGCALK